MASACVVQKCNLLLCLSRRTEGKKYRLRSQYIRKEFRPKLLVSVRAHSVFTIYSRDNVQRTHSHVLGKRKWSNRVVRAGFDGQNARLTLTNDFDNGGETEIAQTETWSYRVNIIIFYFFHSFVLLHVFHLVHSKSSYKRNNRKLFKQQKKNQQQHIFRWSNIINISIYVITFDCFCCWLAFFFSKRIFPLGEKRIEGVYFSFFFSIRNMLYFFLRFFYFLLFFKTVWIYNDSGNIIAERFYPRSYVRYDNQRKKCLFLLFLFRLLLLYFVVGFFSLSREVHSVVLWFIITVWIRLSSGDKNDAFVDHLRKLKTHTANCGSANRFFILVRYCKMLFFVR